MVYLNGGASGIGGGLIVHGSPVGGSGGYAGEFGQNRPGIAAQDDRRAAGGVLEDEVSRARLLAVAGLHAADEPTLAAALAGSDSPEVAAELARQRRILSTALANAVNVLNPSLVVLGGFLATVAESDPAALAAAVAEQAMPAAAEGLDIRVAALGEDRLAIGAAELAFEQLLADPLQEALTAPPGCAFPVGDPGCGARGVIRYTGRQSNRFEAMTAEIASRRRPPWTPSFLFPGVRGRAPPHSSTPRIRMSSTASIPIIRPDDYSSVAHPGDLLSRRQRLVYVLVLGALTALGPFTVDLYLPAFPVLQDELGVSAAAVQLTLTGTMIGFGFGQLIVGPWSDKVGRRLPLILATALHIAASVAAALAPDIVWLSAFRLLQGFGAAAGGVVAMAMVRDLFGGKPLVRMLSRLALVNGLAPVLAPVIGSQLLGVMDWRGVFVVLADLRRASCSWPSRSSSSRPCPSPVGTWPGTRRSATATPRSSATACTSARRSSAA